MEPSRKKVLQMRKAVEARDCGAVEGVRSHELFIWIRDTKLETIPKWGLIESHFGIVSVEGCWIVRLVVQGCSLALPTCLAIEPWVRAGSHGAGVALECCAADDRSLARCSTPVDRTAQSL